LIIANHTIYFPSDRLFPRQKASYKSQLIDRSLGLRWLGPISTCSLDFFAVSFTYLRRLGLFFWPVVTAAEEYLWLRFVSAQSYLLLAAVYLLAAFAYWVCFMSGEGEGVQWTRKLGNSATESPGTSLCRQSLANFFPSYNLLSFLEFVANYPLDGQWVSAVERVPLLLLSFLICWFFHSLYFWY